MYNKTTKTFWSNVIWGRPKEFHIFPQSTQKSEKSAKITLITNSILTQLKLRILTYFEVLIMNLTSITFENNIFKVN